MIPSALAKDSGIVRADLLELTVERSGHEQVRSTNIDGSFTGGLDWRHILKEI